MPMKFASSCSIEPYIQTLNLSKFQKFCSHRRHGGGPARVRSSGPAAATKIQNQRGRSIWTAVRFELDLTPVSNSI